MAFFLGSKAVVAWARAGQDKFQYLSESKEGYMDWSNQENHKTYSLRMAAFVAGKDDRVEEVPKETNCAKDIFQLEMTILNKESATQMHTAPRLQETG